MVSFYSKYNHVLLYLHSFAGDIIVQIDQQELSHMSLAQATLALGTSSPLLRLGVYRPSMEDSTFNNCTWCIAYIQLVDLLLDDSRFNNCTWCIAYIQLVDLLLDDSRFNNCTWCIAYIQLVDLLLEDSRFNNCTWCIAYIQLVDLLLEDSRFNNCTGV